ncbi:HBL/NHE enterotoxin family protein [Bacillus toyonensis]|uniref:non-hemolytic enterotoxin subunit B n=1 Tax=Bacillus toyonensis TaxID=155322 RepID=UPI003D1C9960
MKKKPFKIIVFSALIVAASNLMPKHTLAVDYIEKPTVISTNTIGEFDTYPEYSLGPEGLRSAIEKTGSNALVMDLYALTIIKMANINLNDVTVVDDSLRTKIALHQNIARENAKKWLNKIKPQLISTNQNIINYNTKFQNYYDTLAAAVDNKDKLMLTKGLTRLYNSILENKENADRLVDSLRKFRNKMTEDTQNFKGDSNQLTSILSSQDAGIPLLQSKMTAYNEAVRKLNSILIGSAVATAIGPVAIVGGIVLIATGGGAALGVILIAGGTAALGGGVTGVVLAKKELDNAYVEIQKVAGQITEAQAQIANLTNVKNQTEYLTNTIDIAITAMQNISNQWYKMGAKYNSLLQNIHSISREDFAFIKEDISIARDSWNDIKEYSEKIHAEDIKIVDTEPE